MLLTCLRFHFVFKRPSFAQTIKCCVGQLFFVKGGFYGFTTRLRDRKHESSLYSLFIIVPELKLNSHFECELQVLLASLSLIINSRAFLWCKHMLFLVSFLFLY